MHYDRLSGKSKPTSAKPDRFSKCWSDDYTVKDCLTWTNPQQQKNPAIKRSEANKHVVEEKNPVYVPRKPKSVEKGSQTIYTTQPDREYNLEYDENADRHRRVIFTNKKLKNYMDDNSSTYSKMTRSQSASSVRLWKGKPVENAAERKSRISSGLRGRTGKFGKKRYAELDEDPDVNMNDLMHQRYRREFLARRELELKEENDKRKGSNQKIKDKRKLTRERSDSMANRASKLRSEYLLEQRHFNELPENQGRYKNAYAHISTFRGFRGSSGGGGSASALVDVKQTENTVSDVEDIEGAERGEEVVNKNNEKEESLNVENDIVNTENNTLPDGAIVFHQEAEINENNNVNLIAEPYDYSEMLAAL